MKATLDLRGQPSATPNWLLDRAIAEYVLKREVDVSNRTMRGADETMGGQTFESWVAIPCYSLSADRIIPLLDAQAQWRSDYRLDRLPPRSARCVVVDGWEAYALTFPMAAAIALLRAHGVIVLT